MRSPVLNKDAREGGILNSDQTEMEALIDTQYDTMVTAALLANDTERVNSLKWGRLFLTQKYGYWVG